MIRLLKGVCPYLIIFAAIFLWCFGFTCYKQLSDICTTAVIHLNDDGISMGKIKNMRQSKIETEFSSWLQLDNQAVKNAVFGTYANADVITVNGNSGFVLPTNQVLSPEDLTGCLVDEKTAVKLFGSTAVKDNEIIYDGNTYVIRGTFSSANSLIIVGAKAMSDYKFTKISIPISFAEEFSNAPEEFAMGHMLSYSKIISSSIYSSFAAVFVFLIPIVLGTAMLIMLLSAAYKKREYPVIFTAYVLLALAVTAVYFFVINIGFDIPQNFIPTKWSDFGFWQRLIHQLQNDAAYLLTMKKNKPDIVLEVLLAKSMFACLGGLILTYFAVKIPITTNKRFFAVTFVTVILTFACVVICGVFFPLENADIMIWIAFPFFFMVKRLVYKLQEDI